LRRRSWRRCRLGPYDWALAHGELVPRTSLARRLLDRPHATAGSSLVRRPAAFDNAQLRQERAARRLLPARGGGA
jgi:hypothetical protein